LTQYFIQRTAVIVCHDTVALCGLIVLTCR